MEVTETSCCAVMDISGIQQCRTPEAVLAELLDTEWTESCTDNMISEWLDDPKSNPFEKCPPFTLFTYANRSRHNEGIGGRLALFIVENGLGEVTALAPAKNPNSGNYVTPYLWALNKKGLNAYFKKVLAEDIAAERQYRKEHGY